uniref:Glutamate--cysteine ligase n=1 Tax=Steinernema glaseri TaxID=37863 RepID=A0A1I7ZFV0_9BILA
MVLEFHDENVLPWNLHTDRTEIFYGKTKLFEDPTAYLKILEHATQWTGAATTINKMSDSEAPDYRYFRKRIEEASSKSKIDLGDPIQWNEKRTK